MLTGSEHSTAEWRQPRREGGNQESLVGDFSLDLLERVGVRPNDSEANIDSPVCGRSKVRRLVRIHRPCIAVSGNREQWLDRKSTRLNSSHVSSSYAGFCLKKTRRYMAG